MNFNKYKMKEYSPRKLDFTTKHYYKNGVLVATKVGTLPINTNSVSLNDCVVETIVDEESFKIKTREYQRAKNKLNKQFEIHLARELNLENHPKWDKLYELANSYSDGSFEGVYCVAEELAELLY